MWRSSQKSQVFRDLYNIELDDDPIESTLQTSGEDSLSSSLVSGEEDSDTTVIQEETLKDNSLFFIDDHGNVKIHSKRVEKTWKYTRNESRRRGNTLETSGKGF